MKFALIFLLVFSVSLVGYTQNNPVSIERIVSMSYLDAQGNLTDDPKKMVFISRTKKADSVLRWDYYQFRGPIVFSKSYKDADKKILHGMSAFYTNGMIDSVGNFKENLQDGIWLYRTGNKYNSKNYKEGKVYEQTISEMDSLKKILAKDSLTKFAEYEGGLEGWRNYLVKNFKYPQRAISLDVEGTVQINFIIDKDGNVLNPYIGRSVEMSIDETSLSLIKRSSKWTPAEVDGRKVKCFFVQPVTFRLQ